SAGTYTLTPPATFTPTSKEVTVGPDQNDIFFRGPSTTINQPPVAQDQNVSTSQGTSLPITLVATDADKDLLTYSIDTPPTHGLLSGTAPQLTYIPSGNYTGSDFIKFKAQDGKVDSNLATVSITITSS